MTIGKYVHLRGEVSVKSDLKGAHPQYCLCHAGCVNFKPGEKDNCEIAAAVYENCVKFSIVTPV